MGTVNVLECIRTSALTVTGLNVTTDKVYENREIPGYRYVETDQLDGFDPYSNSKSCSELVTHSYISSYFQERGVTFSTARAGNVIGGGDYSANRIIPDAVYAFFPYICTTLPRLYNGLWLLSIVFEDILRKTRSWFRAERGRAHAFPPFRPCGRNRSGSKPEFAMLRSTRLAIFKC